MTTFQTHVNSSDFTFFVPEEVQKLRVRQFYLNDDSHPPKFNFGGEKYVDCYIRRADHSLVAFKHYRTSSKAALKEANLLHFLGNAQVSPKVLEIFQPCDPWLQESMIIVMDRLAPLPPFKQLSVRDVHSITKQLLKCLQILHHDFKMSHNQIRPENLMTLMDQNQIQLRLVGFGDSTSLKKKNLVSNKPKAHSIFLPPEEGK